MADLKTKPDLVTMADFLSAVTPPVRRADAERLIALFEQVAGEPATLWGPSIIGFGRYHYRYDSGHEGVMCRVGFSPRKAKLVLYLPGFPEKDAMLARLGKHSVGKSCLYIGKLADIDMAVLEEMVRAAWLHMNQVHPD